ncbi:MAG TPA: SEC-C metal-binding domain-containing protein [Pseudonocardiaceae bacterium]|jgi:hypothetical protein|nr:SEC-C metal-binding domain-containing protein [Pseudonocardiaceae bacterium]
MSTIDTTHAAKTARELEACLDDYPDERGEILVEAAGQWQLAGDHDRAIELLTEAIALRGEDGGNARVTMAESLFDLDRDDDARAQFDALRRDRPPSPMPYHLAAELLEERGDYQDSLTWFNMAVSRLSDEDLATPDDSMPFSYGNQILVGRRRVRQELDIPPDELDESVVSPPDFADDLDDEPRPAPPGELRVLFWPRAEVPRAHHAWPQLVEHIDADAIMREREADNREVSAAGVARITLVPLTVAELTEFATRTGGDPTDSDTRMACMNEIAAIGATISWPPGRNAPCWCGSAVKYKKCCGRPDLGIDSR